MPNEATLDDIAAELLAPEEATGQEAPRIPESEDSPPESPPDPQEATPETEEPPKTLTAAEFYQQQVPGTDGLTYSEFKDRVKDLAQADTLRRSLEKDRVQFQKQLADLKAAGVLPELPEELKVQAQEMSQYHQQQQASIILENIPDWAQKRVLNEDVDTICEHWSQYGYSRQEIEQFISNDARFALREKHLLEDRRALQRAKEKVKASQAKARAPTQAINRDQKGQFAAMSDDQSLSAEDRKVAALLGGFTNGS